MLVLGSNQSLVEAANCKASALLLYYVSAPHDLVLIIKPNTQLDEQDC